MLDATLDEAFVILCDWNGRLVWSSRSDQEIGEFVWDRADEQSKETIKTCVARVASLQQEQRIEVRGDKGQLVRASAWPLASPDNAVCILCIAVPRELSLLAPRELECLSLLGKGIPPKQIAAKLGVSLSTVHTHLQRSREKLKLKTSEALISFAARYCRSPASGGDG